MSEVFIGFGCGKRETELISEWYNFIQNKVMKHPEWPSNIDMWESWGADYGNAVSTNADIDLDTLVAVELLLLLNNFENRTITYGKPAFVAKDPNNIPTSVKGMHDY